MSAKGRFARFIRSVSQRMDFARRRIHVSRGSRVDQNTVIGRCTRINRPSEIGRCTIGAYCAIGGRLVVRSTDHYMGYANIQDWTQQKILRSKVRVAGKSKGEVVIGNAVWIGDSVIILPGVTVGNGAVIGAGSVVTKPIPAYSVAVGNPARVVRKRFADDVIALLEQVHWWEWGWDTLLARKEFFETDLSKKSANEIACMLRRLGVKLEWGEGERTSDDR
ncbi:MAG: CatB-related O-acetyltransferase [Luteimonas sp.]